MAENKHSVASLDDRDEKRSYNESIMIQKETHVDALNLLASVESPPTKKRKRDENKAESNEGNVASTSTNGRSPPTQAQTDIRRMLNSLSRCAPHQGNQSTSPPSAATESQIAQIPGLLLHLIASHSESDHGAVALAAAGLAKYAKRWGSIGETFRQAIVAGGTEMILQALQQLGPSYWKAIGNNKHDNANVDNTASNIPSRADRTITKQAILSCWGVAGAGVGSGRLSTKSLLLIIQACLADLDDVRFGPTDANNNHKKKYSDADNRDTLDIVSRVLGVLQAAVGQQQLSLQDLAYESRYILTSVLGIVAKTSSLGMEGAATAENDRPMPATELPHESRVLKVLEDALGVLVVCARRGLLRKSDYERLVQVCKASLYRFVLSSSNRSKSNRGNTRGSSIPVRVVQLIEAEDKTVGLWLKHTYGIGDEQEEKNNSGDLSMGTAAILGGGEEAWEQLFRQQANNSDKNDSSNTAPPPAPPPPPTTTLQQSDKTPANPESEPSPPRPTHATVMVGRKSLEYSDSEEDDDDY